MNTTIASITVAAAERGAADKAEDCFRENGVVVVTGTLPSEVCDRLGNHLRQSLAAVDDVLAGYGLSTATPGAGGRIAALLQDPALVQADRHLLQGHFPLSARLHQVSWAIPQHLDESRLLHRILGTKSLYAHMPPMFRFVLPGNGGAAVPAHRDDSYNAHLERFCTVWVPLVDIDSECAGMAVYPGSHLADDASLALGDANPSGWLPPVKISGFDRVELHPLMPTDIVVMDRTTVHESMANRSNRTRLSADYRFFGEGARSTKHYLDIARGVLVAPQATAAGMAL